MKLQLGIIALVVACLWWAEGPTSTMQAAPPDQGPAPGDPSTPQLIEAARARGDIDQETAHLYLAYALGDYEKLPPEYRSQVPWDGTLPLLRLQQAARTMSAGPARQDIVVILSGACGSSSGSLTIFDSAHFHIEYGSILGGLNISNYANSLEGTWSKEVISFGWAAPPLSSNPPPGGRYHVRIDTLGAGLYGYVTNSGVHAGFVGNNPNTSWDDVDAYATCMVLNRDFSPFPGTAQQAMDATIAHEFNHSIQFGYGALTGSNAPDDSFAEAGATWMEDEVYDAANDNYNYPWPQFNMCMGQYTASPYPYWITFRGLTERYGTGTPGAGEQVMQDFWQSVSQSASSNMLNDLNTALGNKGTSLADAYHAYAVAVKFNKTCGGGYVYPHCFEEAAGYLATHVPTSVHGSIAAIGGSYTGSLADNYALNWVSLPTGGIPYDVTLQNTSAGGQLRASVVCDTGSALSVNALPVLVGAGGSATLSNFNPSGCSSVVAVLTNQSQTAANPGSCTARSYQLRTASSVPPDGEVVINELEPGASDAVELYNRDSQAVVMTGWNFRAYSGSGSLEVNYTFPGFTLQSGAYVVLHKGSGSNTPTDLYLNANITWANGGSGAAALIGGGGSGVDFLRFGSSSVAPPAGTNWTGANPAGPPASQTLGRRSTSMDTDDESDWCAQAVTLGTRNVGCGGETILFLPIVLKNASGGQSANGGIANGDFENGPSGWTESSTHGWDLIVTSFSGGVTPHSGSWGVWLGGDYDEVSYIQQQVTVPISNPYLAYWHWIASEDNCGFDFGKVIVNGAIVADVYDLCTSENTGGWVKHVVNLGAFGGQSVSLQIRVETDFSLNSNLFVDDVSFQASALAVQGDQGLFEPQTVRTKSGQMTSPQERERLLEGK